MLVQDGFLPLLLAEQLRTVTIRGQLLSQAAGFLAFGLTAMPYTVLIVGLLAMRAVGFLDNALPEQQ